ncbi:MAG TPA: chromate efflux transporter [Actinomycetota bacterium]
MSERAEPDASAHGVSFREAARFWIKLGFVNFGGPAGQIAIMHEELVERRRWISNGRFLHALNFCMLLPGPEAQQLAVYIGWLLHRMRGGLLAGIAFIAPASLLMLVLSWVYVTHGEVTWVAGILAGLAPAVIGIVASATIRIAQKALANALMLGVAIAAFVGIFLLHVPFPVIVLTALLIGYVGGARWPHLFTVGVGEELERNEEVAIRDDAAPSHARPSHARSLVVLVVGLAIWLVPIALVAAWRGPDDTITEMGWFFSKAALVTFGGAYAVLAYVNVAAVSTYGWLLPGQMVVGLGLAETTPGPLIMVVEFVGFVGAYRQPGDLDPLVAGILGAAVVLWATFAPCFLWIFLGAPYVERLRGNRRLASALETVTAAVVGVIANLAVTFAISTLFDEVRTVTVFGGSIPWPVWSSVDPFAVAVAAVSFVGLWRFRWKVVPVVLVSALAGLIVRGWLAP